MSNGSNQTITKSHDELPAITYRRETQMGTAFVTINSLGEDIIRTIINAGKAGDDIFALTEALSRVMGIVWQMPDGLSSRERSVLIIDQLEHIGGAPILGVRSLPDALAEILKEHIEWQ